MLFRRFYNKEDLKNRAQKINAFRPDLTVCLHYNVHEEESTNGSNVGLSLKNYNMTFVPGSFCSNELNEKESRYEFMRLLVSCDLERSVTLSRCIISRLGETLKVPVVSKNDQGPYLEKVCLEVAPGIYSRNLALTRQVHGPICYGETLCQNNIDEVEGLNRRDLEVGCLRGPKRAQEVAEGYFLGIMDYFSLLVNQKDSLSLVERHP